MLQDNLHKSDDGWQRFRERTNAGARARRAHMEHRPRSAFKSAAKSESRAHVTFDLDASGVEMPSESSQPRMRGRRHFRFDDEK